MHIVECRAVRTEQFLSLVSQGREWEERGRRGEKGDVLGVTLDWVGSNIENTEKTAIL